MDQTIKQTFVSPGDIFIATGADPDTRYVTDRFILWRMDMLPRKARAALNHIPDGVWSVSAGGAVATPKTFAASSVPPTGAAMTRLMDVSVGDELTRTSVTIDSGRHGARVYASGSGALVGVDDALDLGGYRLHATEGKQSFAIMRSDVLAAILMPVRIEDELNELRSHLAAVKPAA